MKERHTAFNLKVSLMVALCLFAFLPTAAQTFTQRVQQKTSGKGTVTIQQSESIDQLVNNAVLGKRPQPVAPAVVNTPTTSKTPTTSNTTPASNESSASSARVNTPDTAGEQNNEGVKIVHGSYKVTGYRVQAFAGGNSRKDRKQAERTRTNIKSYYPNVPVYVHFYSPRWICRVGNYRTYEEAHQMMNNLKELGFNQCTIVKGKIQVAY